MLHDYLSHRVIGSPIEPLAVAYRNARLRLKARRHPEIAEALLESLFFEAIFGEFIEDGMNCVDAGAHLGVVLAAFARYSPSGRHIAFEPTPRKAGWLRRRFPKADIRETALLDERCRKDFYHMDGSSAYNGLALQETDEADTAHASVMTVDCEALDDAVGERPIGFLKIDVEGAELPALRGARRVLKNDRPPILFECTKPGLAAFGHKASQVYATLREFGYDIFLPRPAALRGEPLDEEGFARAMVYPFRAWNFLALPQAN